MLPLITQNEDIKKMQTPVSRNNRIERIAEKEASMSKSDAESLAPSLTSIIVPKSKFLARSQKNDIKIHLSCSESMRQTHYNKLVSAVTKFDTQRIRKAIKEGKIRNLIRTEKDNPSLLGNINQTNLEKKNEKKRHIDSPDDSKILKARTKNKEIVSRTALGETKFTPKFVKPVTNLRIPTRSVERRGKDPLTPFEMRLIKEKISVSSVGNKKRSMPHNNIGSTFDHTQFKEMRIGDKNLSPRLEEFLMNKKTQISQIMTDSEQKKSEISEYPERKFARLKEPSFENIHSSKRLDALTGYATESSQDRAQTFQTPLLKKDLETFHFKIDLNIDSVKFKKELHIVEEMNTLDEAKTLRESRNKKFLSKVHEENKSIMRTNKRKGFPVMPQDSEISSDSIEEAPEFVLESSKCFWKNRPKNKKGCAVTSDHCNKAIICPKTFDQKFMNYLRIDYPKGYWNERNTIEKYHEILDAAVDPLDETYDKRQLLFDCTRLLRTIIKPAFTGSCSQEINLLDSSFVDDLLEQKNSRGIDFSRNFCKQELDLIQEYEQVMKQIQYKNIQRAFWKPLREASGMIPPSLEGATMTFHNEKLYVYGGFGTYVYNEIRCFDLRKKCWNTITPKNDIYDVPFERFGHSMIKYKEYFLVFGGAGKFNKRANMRVSYKDLNCYDISKEKWVPNFDKNSPAASKPDQRMYHASAIFGHIMFIQGGINTEDKKCYGDLYLYDCHDSKWVELYNPSIFTESKIGKRCMHTMTTVISKASKMRYTSTIWKKHTKEASNSLSSKYWGIYMFGGFVEGKGQTNDLFLIKPKHRLYKKNEDVELNVEINLLKPAGKPPVPRILHSSLFLSEKYLLIYGGKSDIAFNKIKNLALNDICLYDIENNKWDTLVTYGFHPMSRWSQCMCPISDDTIIMFGGTNLESYCPSTLHVLDFNNVRLTKFVKKFESGNKHLKVKRRQVLKEK
ncbi:unnamed protein product [Moneuplotes crassus]|uniref:Uncharacterized protein n=1 Tax=Euplotes crassus TaxID=5936 RepID=A0AAD1Y4F2_EUPCR|nr:unnamed protein product [Moneuplotes crassus]